MKFFDVSTSPSPRRVRIVLAEKGAEFETVTVDTPNGAHLKPDFLSLNPWATVPVLQLNDGTCISEAIACCRYLEDAYPNPPLMGVDKEEKAMVADMQWRMEIDGFLAVGESLRNSAPGLKNRALTGPDNYEQIPELADRGRERVKRFFTVVNKILNDRTYIAGKNFSIADITAFCAISFADRLKFEIPEEATNLRRWLENINSRPSTLV